VMNKVQRTNTYFNLNDRQTDSTRDDVNVYDTAPSFKISSRVPRDGDSTCAHCYAHLATAV
jgi:hypothetical protein